MAYRIINQGDYEDDGFMDSFNALKRQMDYVNGQYRDQLYKLGQRKIQLDKDVFDSIKMTIIIALIPAAYNLLILFLSLLGGLSGLFSVFYVFLSILNLPVLFVCEVLLLPGVIRNMANRLWQKKLLNSGADMMTFRQKNHVISFDDEKRFLEAKIKEYDGLCTEIEEKKLEQQETLDRMRKLTIYEECYATVAETRRNAGPEWLIIGFSIFVAILCFLAVLVTK